MFREDVKGIRYHLAPDFELESGEPAFLETLEPGTTNWAPNATFPKRERRLNCCKLSWMWFFLRSAVRHGVL